MDTEVKKKIKKIIAAVVIIAVILSGVLVINAHRIEITYRIVYSIMPDTFEAIVGGDTPLPLYKRLNPNYDSKKDAEIDFMEFYYYDENGNEVVVGASDELVYREEHLGSPYLAFVLASGEKIQKIKTIAKVIGVIIGLAILAALIVFWFFRWSKKQDEEKEKKYGNSNKHKKKNKNKKRR